MNWGFILPILACILFWLALGYAVSHRDELPAIFTQDTTSVEDGDLWELSFR